MLSDRSWSHVQKTHCDETGLGLGPLIAGRRRRKRILLAIWSKRTPLFRSIRCLNHKYCMRHLPVSYRFRRSSTIMESDYERKRLYGAEFVRVVYLSVCFTRILLKYKKFRFGHQDKNIYGNSYRIHNNFYDLQIEIIASNKRLYFICSSFLRRVTILFAIRRFMFSG